MKILFTGSRDWRDWAAVDAAFDRFLPTSVAYGDARGLDAMADKCAESRNIPRERFHANWTRYGRSAGMRRNRTMYDTFQPDLVLAFPLPGSRGTWGMVEYARAQGCERVLVWGEDF